MDSKAPRHKKEEHTKLHILYIKIFLDRAIRHTTLPFRNRFPMYTKETAESSVSFRIYIQQEFFFSIFQQQNIPDTYTKKTYTSEFFRKFRTQKRQTYNPLTTATPSAKEWPYF